MAYKPGLFPFVINSLFIPSFPEQLGASSLALLVRPRVLVGHAQLRRRARPGRRHGHGQRAKAAGPGVVLGEIGEKRGTESLFLDERVK